MNESYTSTYDRSYALVVGINAYTKLPPLSTAVHDAEDVAATLSNTFRFDVTLLRDAQATRDGILSQIQNLTRTNLNDRVLIYYAGHGMTRSTTSGDPVGLLVPYGVSSEEYERAIEMDYLVDRSKYIPAKHILFVMDACFSGLAVTRSVSQSSRLVNDLMMRRAVQAIAAGQQDQMVTDSFGPGGHSIFTAVLLDTLTRHTNLLTGNELGLHLQRQVGQHTQSRQTPQFGHLLGSQGGDFVFWAEETAELPAELREAINSSQAWIRQGAIAELASRTLDSNFEMAALARQTLARMAEYDASINVREAAKAALDRNRPKVKRNVAAPSYPASPVRKPAPKAAPSPVRPSVPAPARKVTTARKTPFFRRWWRVAVELTAILLFAVGGNTRNTMGDILFASAGAPFALVGIDHALHGRWARSLMHLVPAAVWFIFEIGPVKPTLILAPAFFSAPILLFYAIADAIADEAV